MLVARIKKEAVASAVGPGVSVPFYIAIDATKVARVIEVSDSYKAIIGGAFQNHMFDISDFPKDDFNTVIAGSSALVKINKVTEVKFAVMSLQLTSSGVTCHWS